MNIPIFDERDYQENRVIGSIGYVFFFVPLIVNYKSAFNRYCANQGLLLAIIHAIVSVIFWLLNLLLGFVPLVGALLRVIDSLAELAIFAVLLYHAYLAYNGKTAPVPYIGEIELIK